MYVWTATSEWWGWGAGCETTVKQSTKGNNLIRSKKLDEISVYVIEEGGLIVCLHTY